MKKRLVLKSTDNGFCRVYFRHGKALYCFQWVGSNESFYLLKCTRDGEPCYPEPVSTVSVDKLPTPSCTTSRQFVAWAQKEGLEVTP